MILMLLACERDPTFLGYWDIAAMRVGATEETADAVTQAGFIEFVDDGPAAMSFAYVWAGRLEPDPTPDLVFLDAWWDEGEDFIEGYKSEGETYTLTLSAGSGADSLYDVVDWQGSSVTLTSDNAMPPGEMDMDGARMFVSWDLQR